MSDLKERLRRRYIGFVQMPIEELAWDAAFASILLEDAPALSEFRADLQEAYRELKEELEALGTLNP